MAVRAAGLLVIGLMLPELAHAIGTLLQQPDVVALRYGHEHAVVGYITTVLVAFTSLTALMLWWIAIFSIGIAMVMVRAGPIRRFLKLLGTL